MKISKRKLAGYAMLNCCVFLTAIFSLGFSRPTKNKSALYNAFSTSTFEAFVPTQLSFCCNLSNSRAGIPFQNSVLNVNHQNKLIDQSVPVNSFDAVDKHARNCPNSEQQTIPKLANYLKQIAKTDIEKARAIFVWLTKNISYDAEGYNTNRYGDLSAEGVLKSRKAVCEGFSNLFYALGKQMNLEIEKVSGYAKGYGYTVGDKFISTDHAWNAIKIAGQWRIFDATWGEGYGFSSNGKLVCKKKFEDYWFDVNPYEAIFSHLPENSIYQSVDPLLDLKTYELIPYVPKAYFQLGFDAISTYKTVLQTKSVHLPECYFPATEVKVKLAPAFRFLELNKPYNFEIYAPQLSSISVIDFKNNWEYFEPKNGLVKIAYTPKIAGQLKIAIRYDKGGELYHTILTYTVKSNKVITR